MGPVEQTIGDLQVQLHNVLNRVEEEIKKSQQRSEFSRELALVKTKLDEGEMWLERHVKAVGQQEASTPGPVVEPTVPLPPQLTTPQNQPSIVPNPGQLPPPDASAGTANPFTGTNQ